jgi:hypothetical protein
MNKNQRGFTAVEALIILLVVVVLGGVGYFVWHRDKDKKNTASTTTSTTTNQNNATVSPSPSPTPEPDPYTGWKTYTDSAHHYSFKYPATGWKIDNNSSEQTALINTDETIEVDYLYVDPHDNGLVSFNTVSISNMHDTSPDLKIIGGLYDGVDPRYNVVDASLLKTYHLTAGQTSQFLGYPHFTDTHIANGTTSGTFRVRSAVSGTQSKAWFTTADAKASLLILQSLSYQK